MLNIIILWSQTKLLTTHFPLVSILVMFTYHNGMAFTTKDRDNDKSGGDITVVITPTSTVTMEIAFTSGTGSSTEAR